MNESPDLDAYFRRIGYRGHTAPTFAALREIHALHAAAIPFENLSPLLGEPVPLDLASLEAKLVRSARGGWCFEQNLLFAHVLEALGFDVTRLAARVRWSVPAGVTTARSHMLMRVRLEEGDYIADVGFGGVTLTGPLALIAGVEQPTPHEPHRLMAEGAGYRLEARIAGEWHALYHFDLHEQLQSDYEVSNWYLSTHPASQFLSGVMAARAAPEARHTLRNTRYSIHRPDGTTERRVVTRVDEMLATLSGPLQIAVPRTPNLRLKLQEVLDANPA